MQRMSWLIILSLLFIILPAQAESLVAGEVTAVVGEAVVSAAGQRTAAQGMQLYVGDVLQTGAGAHLHLRMIDGALVSLRPDSKLKITSYTYQPGQIRATKIRLDLQYGTVRSVTGKGGQLAKDLFRMNTPVAAIGVRGTDFIAQADADKTLVHVASGAIVLAPLGAGCQASSLGSCQTASARVLTADMQNMMLELTRGMAEPQLVPLIDKLKAAVPQAADPQAKSQQGSQAPADASGQVAVDVAAQKKTLDSLSGLQVTATPSAPATPAMPAIPSHYQMVWGRWSWAPQQSDLGIPLTEAAAGREVTVGNSTSALFRDNSGPILLPQSGRTEFTLRTAQVSLQQATGQVQGQVQNGTLGVDFNASSFNTRLNIVAPSLVGPVALIAVGRVRDDGIMLSTASGSNGFVAGSLSRTGTEAGYLFELPTPAGKLTGTTLWIK